jgi:ABC-type amino acid transport system permease subunit
MLGTMEDDKPRYLHHRPHFMIVVGWGIGVPLVIYFLWLFGSYGGLGFWLFLIAVVALSSWVSAYLMWFVFSAIYLHGTDETDAKRKPGA